MWYNSRLNSAVYFFKAILGTIVHNFTITLLHSKFFYLLVESFIGVEFVGLSFHIPFYFFLFFTDSQIFSLYNFLLSSSYRTLYFHCSLDLLLFFPLIYLVSYTCLTNLRFPFLLISEIVFVLLSLQSVLFSK